MERVFAIKRLFKIFPINKIRRKAYHMDNPACNAGLRSRPHTSQLRKLNCYAVHEDTDIFSYPGLRCAYTGFSIFKTYGLVVTNQNLNNYTFTKNGI